MLTALLFATSFAVGCLMALWRHPIYGLVTYVGVFYLHPPSRWWGQGALADVRWSMIAATITLLAVMTRRSEMQRVGFFKQPATWGMLLCLGWFELQSLWVLTPQYQSDLIEYYAKFLVVLYLIYKCVDSEFHFKLFMWAHVLGCFYFGWIAFTSYSGGRFEGFGGPGLSEANAAAFTMVTGALFGACLLLVGNWWQRLALVGLLALIVNGVVTTISRSGFLALAAGGVIFVWLAPRQFRKQVNVFALLGVVLFGLVTNAVYWDRIYSIKYTGEEIEGIDTGGGRLETMQAQLRMSRDYPLGCGHHCTETLSPKYLDKRFLNVSSGTRASHNTFFSFLVEHGILGATLYLLLLMWLYRSLKSLWLRRTENPAWQAVMLTGIAASVGAMTVADMFVPYVRYEVRFWFIGLVMVLLNWDMNDRKASHRETVGSTR